MVENTTVRGALGRSRALVSGTFWRVWGIRALGALMVIFVGGFILAPFEIVGILVDSDVFSASSGSSHVPVVFVVLTAIGSVVSAPSPRRCGPGSTRCCTSTCGCARRGWTSRCSRRLPGSRRSTPPAPRTAF